MLRLLIIALFVLGACGGTQNKSNFTEGTYCIELYITHNGETMDVAEMPRCWHTLEECETYRELVDAQMELEHLDNPTTCTGGGWWFYSRCVSEE